MKIGFQSSKYNELTLEEELNLTSKENADFFDIFFDEWFPLDISPKEYKKISDLQQKGFSFTVHLPISTPNLPIEKINCLLDFVCDINPLTTTIHFDNLTFPFMEYLAKKTENHTILSIENTIPDKNAKTGEKYVDFMTKVAKIAPVQATFDTGHCYVNKADLIETVSALCEGQIQISTVHAHDNFGTKDSHSPIGEGSIDFPTFFQFLKIQKQNPLIVIEHWNKNLLSLKRIKSILKNIE